MPTAVKIHIERTRARAISASNLAGMAALIARVAALDEGGVGGGAVRVMGATLLAGDSTVALTLATGEKVVGVAPQEPVGIVWQGTTVSGTTHTLQFSGTLAADLTLRVIVET